MRGARARLGLAKGLCDRNSESISGEGKLRKLCRRLSEAYKAIEEFEFENELFTEIQIYIRLNELIEIE